MDTQYQYIGYLYAKVIVRNCQLVLIYFLLICLKHDLKTKKRLEILLPSRFLILSKITLLKVDIYTFF